VSDQEPRSDQGSENHQPRSDQQDTDATRIERESEELKTRVAELDDRWRRAVADRENLAKRVANLSDRERTEERLRVASAFLPIVDQLEMALEHAGADPMSIIEGVRAVRDQAVGVLARLGFDRRDDTGAAFDPARHEAVSTVPASGAEPGTVVGVVRPGYGEGEQQLRPASVVVATRG
jgi:molecular chaperone GrpE